MRDGRECFLVEHCELGSLDKLHTKFNLSEPEKFYSIARGLFLGLLHLHLNNLIHRDIACRNILVRSDWTVAIGDFGLTVSSAEGCYSASKQEPLPWPWMPPETIMNLEFRPSSDIWAAGVTLIEVLTKGGLPYSDQSTGKLQPLSKIGRDIISGTLLPAAPQNTPQPYRDCISACLQYQPHPNQHNKHVRMHRKRPPMHARATALTALLDHIPRGGAAILTSGTPRMREAFESCVREEINVGIDRMAKFGAFFSSCAAPGGRYIFVSIAWSLWSYDTVSCLWEEICQMPKQAGVDNGVVESEICVSPDGSRVYSFGGAFERNAGGYSSAISYSSRVYCCHLTRKGKKEGGNEHREKKSTMGSGRWEYEWREMKPLKVPIGGHRVCITPDGTAVYIIGGSSMLTNRHPVTKDQVMTITRKCMGIATAKVWRYDLRLASSGNEERGGGPIEEGGGEHCIEAPSMLKPRTDNFSVCMALNGSRLFVAGGRTQKQGDGGRSLFSWLFSRLCSTSPDATSHMSEDIEYLDFATQRWYEAGVNVTPCRDLFGCGVCILPTFDPRAVCILSRKWVERLDFAAGESVEEEEDGDPGAGEEEEGGEEVREEIKLKGSKVTRRRQATKKKKTRLASYEKLHEMHSCLNQRAHLLLPLPETTQCKKAAGNSLHGFNSPSILKIYSVHVMPTSKGSAFSTTKNTRPINGKPVNQFPITNVQVAQRYVRFS
eukprot:jgi/Bigna1/134857/aug1.27_g9565